MAHFLPQMLALQGQTISAHSWPVLGSGMELPDRQGRGHSSKTLAFCPTSVFVSVQTQGVNS